MIIPILVGAQGTVLKGFKKSGGHGNQRKNRDHPDHSIVEIGYNTEKSPGGLSRLAVTKTVK